MMREKLLGVLIKLCLSLLLLLGAIGVRITLTQFLGVLIPFLLIVSGRFFGKTIKFPQHFLMFTVFLAILGVSVFFNPRLFKGVQFFLLFLGGGIFWLFAYNFKSEITPLLGKLIILLGIIFALLYTSFIVTQRANLPYPLGNPYFISSDTLYLFVLGPQFKFGGHNHLGDFWALVLIVCIYYLLKSKDLGGKIIYFLIIATGVYLLVISQSRSSYLSLIVGLIFLQQTSRTFVQKLNKKFFLVLLALFLILFPFASLQKSALSSRSAYFVESFLSLIKYPLGTGLGNFAEVSRRPAVNPFGGNLSAHLTHNIVLEVLVGLGIFGAVFVFWLLKVCLDLARGINEKTVLYITLFFAILTNFMFDVTYTNPSMLWFWFVSLGLAQNSLAKIDK